MLNRLICLLLLRLAALTHKHRLPQSEWRHQEARLLNLYACSCIIWIEECVMMRCVTACLVQIWAVAGPAGLNSAMVVILPHNLHLCLYTLMRKTSPVMHDFSAMSSSEIPIWHRYAMTHRCTDAHCLIETQHLAPEHFIFMPCGHVCTFCSWKDAVCLTGEC